MPSRPPLFTRLTRRLDQLRQKLVAEELEDDPRHTWGRREAGLTRVERSERRADACSDAGLPRLVTPPSDALEAVLPGTVWEVTAPLAEVAAAARAAGRQGLLISVELSSCLYSDRLARELLESGPLWQDTHALLRLQPGDRLGKAYLRELQLGDVRLVLTSLPLCLLFDLTPRGLRFKALALDPLGPARDHRKLRALLEGRPQLAPGADAETVRLWKQRHLIELGPATGFHHPFEIGGLDGASAV